MFPDAETFNIDRYPNPHVAFGSGIHHCLGATLARLEGQEALKALAERFPSLYLEMGQDDVEYQPSITFRSIKELPVSWR
jgi:cytochrome P450